jgi:thioredoxin-like negative regulator of GroEL
MKLQRSGWLLALVAAAGLMAADTAGQANLMMEAARKKEVVDGDLNGAIKQYAEIVARFKSDRAATAAALVGMADCYQKMGNSEARKVYEQVLREYADQKEPASTARARLGLLSGAARANSETTSRRVWVGPYSTRSKKIGCLAATTLSVSGTISAPAGSRTN